MPSGVHPDCLTLGAVLAQLAVGEPDSKFAQMGGVYTQSVKPFYMSAFCVSVKPKNV